MPALERRNRSRVKRVKPSKVPTEHTTHPKYGYMVCGAKSDASPYGFCCRRPDSTLNNGRCKIHGRGGRPSKHGMYSQSLPDNIALSIEEYTNDLELTDLKDKLAILQVFLNEKLSRWANQLGSKSEVNSLTVYHSKLVDATLKRDWDKIESTLGDLADAISSMMASNTIEREIREVIRDFKDVASTQTYREVQKNRQFSEREVQVLATSMATAVIEEVADPEIIKRVNERLMAILNSGSTRTVRRSNESEHTAYEAEFRELENQDD